jgi:hypothetical protein
VTPPTKPTNSEGTATAVTSPAKPTSSGGAAAGAIPTADSGLAGYWRNTGVEKPGRPVELHITGANARYRIDVFASCPEGKCSWGMQTVNFDGVQGVAAWSPRATPNDTKRNRTALVTFRPEGDHLNMQIQNTFIDNGQASHENTDLEFAREN